jgi:1-acyl-sn-glycerol-3-phosphate acyltransferase
MKTYVKGAPIKPAIPLTQSRASDPDAAPAAHLAEIRNDFSKFWMGYFLLSIAVLGSALAYCLCIPFYLIGTLDPRGRRVADTIMRWGIGWLMRIQPWFNAHLDLQIPQDQPILLVSNHRSHLDTFILLSQVRGIRVLAKSTLFKIPFLGLVMWASGQIPTQRGRIDSFWKAMEIIRSRLKRGDTVHVFPEMTRCPMGFRGTKQFMVAPFLVAKETGTLVIPMVITGTDQVWPKGIFSIRPYREITVRTLKPLNPADFASAEALKTKAQELINEAL